MSEEETETNSVVKSFLNIDDDTLHALIVCGILRSIDSGQTITKSSVLSYAKFGTLWVKSNPYISDSHFDEVPIVDGKIQPPSSYVQMHGINLSVGGEPDINKDNRFIAHFYLEPNHLFYVDPAAWTTVRGSRISISAPQKIITPFHQVTLYPNPNDKLALISLFCNELCDISVNFETAYNVVGPILDELSFQFDQNIHIVHSAIIYIPSGYAFSNFLKSPKFTMIDSDYVIPMGCPVPELSAAIALYREACSSNNIFHQFLTFWRVYENVKSIRENWRKQQGLRASDRRNDSIDVVETIPDYFCFQPDVGLRFEQVIENLRDTHRNAIAHGSLHGKSIKTSLRSEDIHKISLSISLIRYISRILIINTRSTIKHKS